MNQNSALKDPAPFLARSGAVILGAAATVAYTWSAAAETEAGAWWLAQSEDFNVGTPRR